MRRSGPRRRADVGPAPQPSTARSGRVNTRWPPTTTVSLPSMAAMAAAVSRGRPASRTRASWASRTTPHAPPATPRPRCAGRCRPRPRPARRPGSSASRVWSRTNVVSSPTRPPDSAPRAISPSGAGGQGGPGLVRRADLDDATVRAAATPPPSPPSTASRRPGRRCRPPAGRSAGVRGQPGPTRTPNEAGTHRAASARAARARPRSRPRSSTPSPPARSTAATRAALGSAEGRHADDEAATERVEHHRSSSVGRSKGRSPDSRREARGLLLRRPECLTIGIRGPFA